MGQQWRMGKGVLVALLVAAVALLILGVGNPPINANFYQTEALVASDVVTTRPGEVYAIHGYNDGPGQFIQVFDAATVPADTAVPKIAFWADADSNFFYDTTDRGVAFSNGLAWSNSSTLATKTGGAADVWLNIEYTDRR